MSGSTSRRRSLPSRTSDRCALQGGSSPLPPSPGPHVQVAVGPELQLASVVVRVDGMRNRQERDAARGVGHVRVAGDAVSSERDVSVRVRVVDEEESVVGVAGMEGGREKASLPAAADLARHVEKRRVENARAVPDHDPSLLQREEEAAVARVRDPGDAAEARDERLEHEGRGGRGRGRFRGRCRDGRGLGSGGHGALHGGRGEAERGRYEDGSGEKPGVESHDALRRQG